MKMSVLCYKLLIISLDKEDRVSDYNFSSPILMNSFHLKTFAFIFSEIRPAIFIFIFVTY